MKVTYRDGMRYIEFAHQMNELVHVSVTGQLRNLTVALNGSTVFFGNAIAVPTDSATGVVAEIATPYDSKLLISYLRGTLRIRIYQAGGAIPFRLRMESVGPEFTGTLELK